MEAKGIKDILGHYGPLQTMIQQTYFRCLSWDEATLFHSINWKMSLNDSREGRETNPAQGFISTDT